MCAQNRALLILERLDVFLALLKQVLQTHSYKNREHKKNCERRIEKDNIFLFEGAGEMLDGKTQSCKRKFMIVIS